MSKNGKKICIVIGDPVGHSLSPVLHNAGYEKLGIDNEFSYEARQIRPEKLEDFINSLRLSNVRGVSVTKPHKENVIPLLDEISNEARAIDAVNTILVEGNKLTGHNTDWLGATLSLEESVGLKNKRVVLIGAGGTAKAFAYGLSRANCEVTILNRTEEKASLLANKYGFAYGSLNEHEAILSADIICNTTIAEPIDINLIKPGQIVFDVVYSLSENPFKTKLLNEAGSKGAKTISPVEMLLHQGFAQFKLFTGKDAPEEYIRNKIIQRVQNER